MRSPQSPKDRNRRAFLKAAGVGGLAAALPATAPAQPAAVAAPAASVPQVPPQALEIGPPGSAGPRAGAGRPASDYMVDVLRGLGIGHVSMVPGSTFTALHESIIDYGMLQDPVLDLISVTHEETSVSFAHGYSKVAGEPMACLMHSTVGLQHAAMALYNAYADRAPVFAMTGALTDPASRESFVDWQHAVSDGPGLVREFVKFDETPRSLEHFADSAVRAYRFAMTPPYGPVLLAVDLDLQTKVVDPARPPPAVRRPEVHAPQGEDAAVREAAKMLAAAQSPVIAADRAARTPEGLRNLVVLAELLAAGVVDAQGRMNFPWRHPLNQTSRKAAALRQADVVLGLELQDFAGVTAPAAKARTISINSGDYYFRSDYQLFEPLAQPTLSIPGDSEATLPALIEAVRSELGRQDPEVVRRRAQGLAEMHAAALTASRNAAAVGWDDRPITTARLYAELYDQVRSLDWALLGGGHFQNYWGQQLWDAKAHHQFIGDSGANGLGYLPGAAVGAALAHSRHGRVPIAIGGDGDFLMAPAAIWSAAYHRIPLLYVVHNNGGYHQEIMKVQAQAAERDRGIRRAHIGTQLPGFDFAKIAEGQGVWGARVTEPGDLRGAIAKALDVVRRGEPALLDVMAQGR